MNVSLKNRMSTESHGGGGGAAGDGGDGAAVRALLLRRRRRAASAPGTGGGRTAHCGHGGSRLHRQEQQEVQEVRQEQEEVAAVKMSRCRRSDVFKPLRPSAALKGQAAVAHDVRNKTPPPFPPLSLWTSSRALLPTSACPPPTRLFFVSDVTGGSPSIHPPSMRPRAHARTCQVCKTFILIQAQSQRELVCSN